MEVTAMPKSEVIRLIVDEEMPLAQGLRRLQVLAHDVGNKELERWAECELVGYKDGDDLPEYRVAKSIDFAYSGISNFALKVENVPLSPGYFKEDTLELLADVKFAQSVSSLEDMLDGASDIIKIDRSIFASEIAKRTSNALQCTLIYQKIPKSFLVNALEEIRNRVIKALMAMEDEYGNLDKKGINIAGRTKASLSRSNAKVNEEALNVHVENIDDARDSIRDKVVWGIVAAIAVAVIAGIILKLMPF